MSSVARYTQDARDAFSQNRGSDGKQRVAELKAAVDLLHSLVHNSSKPSSLPLSPISSLSGMSESAGPNIAGTVPQLRPPGEDVSRKRCASAQGGDEDRALKSFKREPKDEPVNMTMGPGVSVPASSTAFSSALSNQAALSIPLAHSAVLTQSLAPPLLHSQTFPGSIHTLGQQHVRPTASAFASPSSSRSESSATSNVNSPNAPLAYQLALLQQQQQQHAAVHAHGLSLSHAAQRASGISPGLSAAPGPAIQNGTPAMQPPPSSQTMWADTDVLAMLGNINQSVPQGQPLYHQFSPSARQSRRSSYSDSYPFAFDLTSSQSQPPPTIQLKPNVEDPHPERPSTSVGAAKSSSPEQPYESDYDDLLGQISQHTPEGHTPPPSNANDIPLELRQSVDDQFFQFLKNICSDCEYPYLKSFRRVF